MCVLPENKAKKNQSLFFGSGLIKAVPSRSLCVMVLETAKLFQCLVDRMWPKGGFQWWL